MNISLSYWNKFWTGLKQIEKLLTVRTAVCSFMDLFRLAGTR